MQIITDSQAVRHVLQDKNRFVCYLGAGLSAEAKVPTAQSICDRILTEVLPEGLTGPQEKERWANENLAWDKLNRRYQTCMRVYGNAAQRVQFFRGLLKRARPAFAHHAVALLMARGYLKRSCVTTNFDKLLEAAFVRHGLMECQPIRHDEELEYLEKEEDKGYVLKLHGDYDTYNILNTKAEVTRLSKKMSGAVADLATGAGMLVLGAAGFEKSIYTLFEDLTSKEKLDEVFPHGLLWGVYVPGPKPQADLTQAQLEETVTRQIEGGAVSEEIVEVMEAMAPRNENFCFFPVWGAGNFLLDLLKATGDTTLRVTAEPYLDHTIRLRQVFERAGLSGAAIGKHIAKLTKEQQALKEKARASPAEHETVAVATSQAGPLEVHLTYGDITKRRWMASDAFRQDVRAVVSPEDTCVSAGGGVAYLLLDKAGPPLILGELSKFSPIRHTTVAVTSGGELPAHYIFHAAALEIREAEGGEVEYAVSAESVRDTTTNILKNASALGVGTLWVPLMGAGVASQGGKFGPQQSLDSILAAVAAWEGPSHPMKVFVVVYADRDLTRDRARAVLRERLATGFTIRAIE
jgi:O-acetyl-ADP-ribose deacetylase (regulator of RNase III)/NAD-dependent SIR2 family protein deacetylase